MSSNPEHEANDAQDIEYGLRDARRRVSYEHRGSSSLSPRQFMEREFYTSWIYYLFHHVLEHLQLMVYFQSTFTRLRLFVHHHSGRIDIRIAVREAKGMMTRLLATVDELHVLVNCFMALAEIAYLHVEDLTIFIRRRNRFTPIRNRTNHS